MITKGIIKKGVYYDSVTLMIVSKNINKIDGVIDSSIVMGTNENKSILKVAGLYNDSFDEASDSEMLIAIKAEQNSNIEAILKSIDYELNNIQKKDNNNQKRNPKSIESAIKQNSDLNFSLISIAGKYAVKEAMKSLENNMHTMIFSDNISIEDELKLKIYAKEKGLMVMGPDCGTAIINGVPLAFANVVNKGDIGIVAASGTGLQEVSTIISNLGAGISQAIGTGGRDVKNEIGGIMFIEAMKALNNDEDTNVIVLVSKPPHESVLVKISQEIAKISKPVIAIFIGADNETLKISGAIPASNLEEAAIIAVNKSKKIDSEEALKLIAKRNDSIKIEAINISNNCKGKYLRGLFSGGTLCDESQLLLKNIIGQTYSNTPIKGNIELNDVWKSEENTIIDLGDDIFTAGKPHPMIDYSLRCNKLIEESQDKDVAVILLDIVLGYGSNLNPLDDLIPAIKKAKTINNNICFITSITGTPNDPQNKIIIKNELEKLGVIVKSSNVEATLLAGEIIRLINKN